MAMAGIMSAMRKSFSCSIRNPVATSSTPPQALKSPDHVRGAERQDGMGQEEQGQKDHQLGQGDEADDDSQFTGKQGGGGQVHDGFGDEDAVIPPAIPDTMLP